MNHRIIIQGIRFGNLTPTDYLGNGLWRCRCECGGWTTANTSALRFGKRKSCGQCNPTREGRDHSRLPITHPHCAYCGGMIDPDAPHCREWDGRCFHIHCEELFMMVGKLA